MRHYLLGVLGGVTVLVVYVLLSLAVSARYEMTAFGGQGEALVRLDKLTGAVMIVDNYTAKMYPVREIELP